MQAPPAYNSATGGVPPSDPNYAGGAPTSHPAPPPRSQAGHSVVGDWQTSCLGVCCDAPGICLYAELCLTDHCQWCGCGPHPINSGCGTCCLCTEALCCFFASVPAHRREIQEQYGVAQGKEEWAAHAVACLSWVPIFGLAGGFFLGYAACCCYACLAAQCEVEIRSRQGPTKQTMA